MAALVVAGSFSIEASAQRHLKALIKKCETIDAVDMNIVRDRDKETNQWKNQITSLTIKDNEALVNEFIAAFKADADSALQIIENKQNGKMVPSLYTFEEENYSFNLKDKAHASVTVVPQNEFRFKDKIRTIKDKVRSAF
jgi:hypothetical protein